MIEAEHPNWSDERVFETARNTVIVLFIKIVVEDYINHILPLPFNLKADPSVAGSAAWNKTSWITTEFSLLYRLHALIPDQMNWSGTAHKVHTTFMNNALLTDVGLLQVFGGFAPRSPQNWDHATRLTRFCRSKSTRSNRTDSAIWPAFQIIAIT